MSRTVPPRAGASDSTTLCHRPESRAQSSVGASQMAHLRAFERQASAGIGIADDIDVGATGRCRASVLQLSRVTRWWPRCELEWPNPSEGSIVSLAASVDVPGHDGSWRAAGGRPARRAPSRTRGNMAHRDCLRYPPGPEPLGWSSGPPPRLGAGSVSWPVMSRRASSGGVVEPAFARSTRHRGEVPVCPAGRAATDCPGRPGRRLLAERVRACAAISKRPSTSSSSVVSSRFGRPQTCGNPIGGRRVAGGSPQSGGTDMLKFGASGAAERRRTIVTGGRSPSPLGTVCPRLAGQTPRGPPGAPSPLFGRPPVYPVYPVEP